MKKKKLIVPVLLLAVLISALIFWHSMDSSIIPGKVEQVVMPHYSEASGKISELHIQQGQTVQAGDVLAILDSSSQENSLKQLEQTLIQQQASLEQVLTGAEPAAIRQAQSTVKAAQAGYHTAQLNFEQLNDKLKNAQALYEIGGIAKQDVDALALQVQTAQYAMDTAAAQVESAQQQVILISGGSNAAAIKKAQAAVAQTELQIAQAQDILDGCTIRALCSGTVISVNYTAGSVIAPGADLAEITDSAQTYVVAYVPEEVLATLSYGDTMQIETDDAFFSGTVSFIDLEAVYTPEEFQSAIQQNQKEYRIKLSVPDDFPAKPGQSVNIHLNRKTI